MSKIFKKTLSMVLALVMVLGMVPVSAFATETEPVEHVHDYQSAVTAEAGCTTEGVMTYTCSCEDSYTEAIPAKGHSYENGLCACGATEPVEHSHDYQSAVTTEAGCTTEGVMTYTCSCEDSYTEAIPAKGHSYENGLCACGAEEPAAEPEETVTPEPPKPELSGETRKVYFHNVEAWAEVYAAWSFDEEYFEDVEFPGVAMSANTELEDVYVVTLPVEADEVLFSDGVEVTDELLKEEEEAGLDITHEIALRLSTSEFYNLYQNGVWANYAQTVEALEKDDEPAADKAPEADVDPVQTLIDSLPASVNSREEYDAVYAVVEEIEENGYELTDEQTNTVFAAMNAADEWYNADMDDPAAWATVTASWKKVNGQFAIEDGNYILNVSANGAEEITWSQMHSLLNEIWSTEEFNGTIASDQGGYDVNGTILRSFDIPSGAAGFTDGGIYTVKTAKLTYNRMGICNGATWTEQINGFKVVELSQAASIGKKTAADDGTYHISYNPEISIDEQLSSVHSAIFNAVVDTDKTVPAGLSVNSFKYQYLATSTMNTDNTALSALNVVPTVNAGVLGNIKLKAFAADGIGATEVITITYPGDSEYAATSIEVTITLTESRTDVPTILAANVGSETNFVEFDSENEVADYIKANSLTIPEDYKGEVNVNVSGDFPSVGQTAALTYTVTLAGDAKYLPNTTGASATAYVKNKEYPATITITQPANGTIAVTAPEGVEYGYSGNYTVTITPAANTAKDGKGYYVAGKSDVAFKYNTYSNTTAVGDPDWNNAVYTGVYELGALDDEPLTYTLTATIREVALGVKETITKVPFNANKTFGEQKDTIETDLINAITTGDIIAANDEHVTGSYAAPVVYIDGTEIGNYEGTFCTAGADKDHTIKLVYASNSDQYPDLTVERTVTATGSEIDVDLTVGTPDQVTLTGNLAVDKAAVEAAVAKIAASPYEDIVLSYTAEATPAYPKQNATGSWNVTIAQVSDSNNTYNLKLPTAPVAVSVKTPVKKAVLTVVNDAEKGSVNKPASGDYSTGSQSVEIAPVNGYVIDKVTLNGQDVTMALEESKNLIGQPAFESLGRFIYSYKYTGSISLADGTGDDYDAEAPAYELKVTYKESDLKFTANNATVSINGHSAYTKAKDMDLNILKATMGLEAIGNYKVYVKVDRVGYVNVNATDDLGELLSGILETGEQDIRIYRDGDPGVYADVKVVFVEKRPSVTITAEDVTLSVEEFPATLDSVIAGKYSVTVSDGSTVTPEITFNNTFADPGEGETYTAKYTVKVADTEEIQGATASGNISIKHFADYNNNDQDDDGEAKYTVVYKVDGVETKFENRLVDTATPAFDADAETEGNQNPTKEYYTFAGWDKTVAANVTDDVTYTATWTADLDVNNDNVADQEQSFTITFNPDNGGEKVTETLDWGASILEKAPMGLTKEQSVSTVYTFEGKWLNGEKELTADTKVTCDAEYVAQYAESARKYTITWNAGNGKFADGSDVMTTSVAYGDTPVAPATPTSNAENYFFAGWVASELMPIAELPAVTGEASYTAIYSPDTIYNVTFMVDGAQYGNIQNVNVTDGEKATAPDEAPEVRYLVFKHWSTEENGAAYDFASEVTDDLVLHAVFDKAVAEIGTKGYTTWEAAYDAANDGDTITLLDDILCYGELRIEKSITVNGNGFSFVADPSYTGWLNTSLITKPSKAYLVAIKANDVTMLNVKFDCAKLAKGIDILTYSNIVLDNVTVLNAMGNAVNINGADVILRNSITANNIIGGGTGYTINTDGDVVIDGNLAFQGTCDYANTNMDTALDKNGNAYFGMKALDAEGKCAGYFTSGYNRDISLLDGYTYELLKDMTLSCNATLAWKDEPFSSATIDLNGYTLTIASGKIIAILGDLYFEGEGSVIGNIDLAATEIAVYGSEDLPVRINAGVPKDFTLVFEDEDEDGFGKYFLYLPLPEVEITDIKDTLTENEPDLTFALNFGIKDLDSLTEEYLKYLMAEYGDWYVDYVLTIEGLSQESVVFNADNENADGYLAGQYDAFGPNWLPVPFEDVTVKNGESFYIMETAAKLMNSSGLRFTLEEIATIVVDFDCGVYFTPEFLEANPNMKVTLELKVFAEEEKQGKDAEISVATNVFANHSVAIIAAEGQQTAYYTSIKDAIEAAADEDVVTLLKAVGDVTVEKSFALEPNGQEIGSLTLATEEVAVTAPEGLNVLSGVEGLDVIYSDGKYSLAVDKNSNNVPDGEETITIVVNKANDADEVTVEATDAEAKAPVELPTDDGTKSYVYDSTKPGIKLIATPVVTMTDIDGEEKAVSSTYVVSIDDLELTYDEKFVATAEIEATNGMEITVDFEEAKFSYDEDGLMRFYVGMEDPDYEALYNAVITDPAYDATEGVVSAKYLARPAATYQMRVPVLFEYTVPIVNYDIKIGGNTVDIDLDDAWLDVGEEFKTLTPEELQKQYDTEIQKIKDKIAAIDISNITWNNAMDKVRQFLAIRDELSTLIATISNEAKYMGYHQFGAGTQKDENGNVQEKVRIIYQTAEMRLMNEELYVTLVDDRTETTITSSGLTFEYDEFDDETIMNTMTLTDIDGNVIEGELIKYVDLVGTEVGERTFTVYYEGSWDYKPATAEFTLTVIKAPSSTNIIDDNITYGESVSAPVVTNKHGEAINIDTIEFFLGLDVNELDIDGDGVKGLEGRMQLIFPESVQTIINAIPGLENGATMNINDLISLLTGGLLDGVLGQWGVSSDMLGALDGILDAINGVVETNNLMITIGGSYPTDVGAYLHGAVTVDKNYETSYDVGYILIKPQVTQYTLEWNDPALTNAVVTLPVFNNMDKGASVVEEGAEDFEVSYVIFGINSDSSDILSTDIYGNIKANIWLNNEELKDNGAYMQIAYGLNWGNEFDYAMPIVRAFAVVPALYDVQLVGDTGTPNDELLKTFDGQPKGFSVVVKDNDGNTIYSDHYQNIVPLRENAQLVVYYSGVQTNGKSYVSTEKPVHAGAYLTTAVYMEFNDGEKIDVSNLSVEDLYELFDLADIGADAGLLVIEPSESTVTVEDQVKVYDGQKVSLHDMVNAASVNYSGNVDTTIISAMVTTDGTFSENGFDSIRGVVNIDFPRWVDELIAEYAPGIANGVTVAQLRDKLINNLPDISAKLEEAGATPEIINSLGSLTENLASALEKLPADAELSFNNDVEVAGVGAYLVMAVVTDSDHYPSADAGLLIITPNVDQVYLKWNYEDSNNVWTPVLLECVDLYASAYDDEAHTVLNDEATAKITHRFLSVDMEGNVVNYTDASQLGLGAYIELAYIELEVDGRMIISDMIARPIIIVPNTVEVEIVDGEGTDFQRVFDNAAQEVDVTVNFGSIEALEPDEKYLTVTYTGIQTNLQRYNSSEAPKHAGVYLVSAVYAQTNEKGDYIAVGADVETLVILPAESETIVDDAIVPLGTGIKLTDLITVNVDSGVTMPDMTIISAQVASDGSFSENGWSAIKGKLNIDFPDWVDALLAEHMPGVADGMTAAELSEMLNGKLPALLEKLEEIGATNEIVNSAKNAIANITKILDKVPEDVTLTFDEASDVFADSVGAYMVAAIVTDSDHYPSADYGLLVVTPDVDQVYLKWNYEDENAVWTHVLLQSEDLYATAFDDDAYTAENAEATAKIKYQFLSLDENGELTSYTDVSELTNGFYIEIAYIEFVVDGVITMSDLIARPVIIAPNAAEVIFVDEKGDENNDRVFTFDNEGKTMDAQVSFGGEVIIPEEGELEITYKGIQTNGKTYNSTEAPVHAGVYLVNATYTSYDEHGLALAGTASGIMVIEPDDSAIEVTGGTVTYDGAGHTASVAITEGLANADYVLISGGVDNANEDELTVEDFIGTVNIDLPRWLDEALAEHEFKTEGVDAAYLTDFITSYRDDLVAAVPAEMLVALGVPQADVDAFLAEMNAYIDELLEVIGKIPADAAITFNDNVTYTEAGYYFFYGIVADSDHYPSGDAGLLVIEPKDITEADVKLGDALTYNGTEQTQGVIVTDGITYEVIGNTGTNAGEYTLTVKGTDNYTGSVDLTWTIAKKDISGAKVTLGKPLTYNGAEQTQGLVSVVIDGLEVTFDATDNKATDAGDYTMTITGNGNFTGTIYEDWSIAKKNIADAKVTLGDALVYNSSEQTKKVVSVTVDGLDVTYDVSGNTGTNAGKYTMTITGNGNFTGTTYVDWYISKATVTVEILNDAITYGTDTPAVKLNYSDEKAEGILSSVKWSAPEKLAPAGTYTAAFTFNKEMLSNWTFSVVGGKLTVNPKNITGAKVTLGDDLVYNTEEQTKTIESVVIDGLTVTYDVEGNTGTNVGDYTMTITGTGNFTGTIYEGWSIAKASVIVTVLHDSITYGEKTPEVKVSYSDDKAKDEVVYDIYWDAPEYAEVGHYAFKFEAKTFPNWNVEVVGGVLTVGNKVITAADITLDDSKLVYDGTEKTQNIIVADGITYTVTGNKATDAGKHILSVTGTGNYGGTVDFEWTIAKANVKIEILSDEITYGADTPAVKLRYSDEKAEGILSSVKWSAPEKLAPAGTYTATFAFNKEMLSNWTFSVVGGKLTVNPKTITGAEVTLAESMTYTGEQQTATPVIKVGDVVLDADDYTVTGNTATNAGKYTMTIEGTGNYTGSVKFDWIMAKANVIVTVVSDTITYGADTPAVKLRYSDEKAEGILSSVKWSAPEKLAPAGTYTAAFSFNKEMLSNWTFSVVGGKLTVNPKTITADDIKLVGSLTYNGKEQTQNITLPEGVSYKVYGNTGVDAGNRAMYVIVEGNGNYTGSVEIPWSIAPKAITGADVALSGTLTYNGNEQTQNITVTEGVTYDVTGNTATNAGKYTMTVTGTDNYTGEVKLDWSIAKAKVTVTIKSAEITYGDNIPAVELVYSDEKAEGILSSVNWSAPEKLAPVGTYTAAFTFDLEMISNWAFSVVGGKLTIVPKALDEDAVKLDGALTYTGEQQTQNISVPEGVTYTVNGNTATDAGNYIMTVTFTGNYAGEVEVKWTIDPKPITKDDITLGEELSYNGKEQTQEFVLPEGYTYTVTGNTGTDAGEYTATIEGTGNYSGKVEVKWTIEDAHPGLYPVYFDVANDDTETIVPGASVEIDGVPYELDEDCIAWVANTDAKIVTTYSYKNGNTVYETYPEHMYVWYLTIVDEEGDEEYDYYTAERIEELDDFFKYEGTSIRINFTSNGIRFFTSVDSGKLNSLKSGTLLDGKLEGFTMTRAGTLYKKWTGDGAAINYESAAASDVYGGKAGSNFRVFSTVNGRVWYTGMLTGLDGKAETLDMDIQSRPFAILERDGESFVLYGGTIQRSIYYVATQNRDVYDPGTKYDDFIEGIITTVEEARGNS